MPKEVRAMLVKDSMKKHSVLFKPPARTDVTEHPIVTGLYLMNTAFKELGEPESVVITIAAG